MIMMHYLHVSFPHRFVLGTRPHALRYINQFTEIFTEEGRKSVKITHRVPNHEPRITYTPGLVRERMNNDKAAARAALLRHLCWDIRDTKAAVLDSAD